MIQSQFTTLEEAQNIAKMLGNIGNGVLPYTPDNPQKSGIYIEEYPFGTFPTPQDGERKFYHFRFTNGAHGINAGLVLREMQIFPTRWPLMVKQEVDAAAGQKPFPWEE